MPVLKSPKCFNVSYTVDLPLAQINLTLQLTRWSMPRVLKD